MRATFLCWQQFAVGDNFLRDNFLRDNFLRDNFSRDNLLGNTFLCDNFSADTLPWSHHFPTLSLQRTPEPIP
jgi:hypothetical protein